jgi:hypothetical protein
VVNIAVACAVSRVEFETSVFRLNEIQTFRRLGIFFILTASRNRANIGPHVSFSQVDPDPNLIGVSTTPATATLLDVHFGMPGHHRRAQVILYEYIFNYIPFLSRINLVFRLKPNARSL